MNLHAAGSGVGGRSPFEELKALKELKDLKDGRSKEGKFVSC